MRFTAIEVIGSCTLYCGDCADVLPEVGPLDLVITSPPYNLGGKPWPHLGQWQARHANHCGSKWRNGTDASLGVSYGQPLTPPAHLPRAARRWSHVPRTGEGMYYAHHEDTMPWPAYVAWQQGILRQLWGQLSAAGAIFYNHKPRVIGTRLWTPQELLPEEVLLRQIIIWSRPGGMNYSPAAFVPTHEWIMVLAKEEWRLKSQGVSGLGDVWQMTPDANPHPAPFPVALPLRCLEATTPGFVCDPFLGSGTTGIACLRMGRRFVGIERDPLYFEMACERLDAVHRQGDLFITSARQQQTQLAMALS